MNTKVIRVTDLIASRSLAQHNEIHDTYFGRYEGDEEIQLARKPFHWNLETPPTLIQMGVMLSMAGFDRGTRVLDYGCGTGWLSRAIAYLRCEVRGVDVSQRAIGLARKIIEEDPLSVGLDIEFEVIDGVTLPYPDASFDRVVCFSAFHHIADQETTLRELSRVLRKGGKAIFNEPGPNHSKLPEVQEEMRQYGVIENDIVIEDINATAIASGFLPMQVAYFSPTPVMHNIDDFNALMGPRPLDLAADALRKSSEQLANIRIFVLEKSGWSGPTSLHAESLSGTVEVDSSRSGRLLSGRVRWKNTGQALWLPSRPHSRGSVLVGVRDGGKTQDLGRIPISDSSIVPGEAGTIEFEIELPEESDDLSFGFVSEHICWF